MLIQPPIDNGKAAFQGLTDKGYWRLGQTLTIGKIVNHKGECVDSLVLEPQGIAHLISEEVIELPEDVCALAHVLTRKCNEGLLTLGIGVVDPGWRNHISSPILNFSAEKRLLQIGDEFIRVTFHRLSAADLRNRGTSGRNVSSDDYVRGLKARAAGDFGKSFLNIKQLVGKASKKENQRLREALLKYVPIGGFSLALFALLVTSGGVAITNALNAKRGATVSADQRSTTDQRVLELENRIRELERLQLRDSQSVRPPRSTISSASNGQRAEPR